MSKARNIADLLDASGNVISDVTGDLTGDVTATTLTIGSWVIQLDTNDLRFTYNGTDAFRVTTAGEIIALDDVTAFGTP